MLKFKCWQQWRPDWVTLLAVMVLPVVHYGLSTFVSSVAMANGASPIWPTTGVYLTAVLLLGLRVWPAILLSELIINTAIYYDSLLISIPISLIDLCDPLLMALLIQRFIGFTELFSRAQTVIKFLGIIVTVSTVTTTLAVTVLCLGQVAFWGDYGAVWWGWWTSVCVGALIVTPALITWYSPIEQRGRVAQSWPIELGIILFLGAVIAQVSFGGGYPLEYGLILLLAWAAFRLGQRELTALIFLLAAIAIWGTAQGQGSFAREDLFQSLALLQSFLAVAALSSLVLSAVLSENDRAALRLQQAHESLAIANDDLAQANAQLEQRVTERTAELGQTLKDLQRTQAQMVQSEKMSSLGQLVAGVAHEINNPVSFIGGNVKYAHDYIQSLLGVVNLYQQHCPQATAMVAAEIGTDNDELDFVKEDLSKLLNSMTIGVERIQAIITSLRNFSRMDEAAVKAVNLQDGIDSTLMILQHRLKAQSNRQEIEVVKDFEAVPLIECYAGQLNQVFMNLLSNAIDALESSTSLTFQNSGGIKPQIHIRITSIEDNQVQVTIADNGPGMPAEVRKRVFDPFFTTKSVGKGTGMGLAISYQIVAEKHHGNLICEAEPGSGTQFIIRLHQQLPQIATYP